MEKYFVIQITKTSDSDVYATAITVKDSAQEARMLYHQILSSVYATANIDHAIVKIDDFYGNTILMETIIPVINSDEEEE